MIDKEFELLCSLYINTQTEEEVFEPYERTSSGVNAAEIAAKKEYFQHIFYNSKRNYINE